jgi:hypothetical protein
MLAEAGGTDVLFLSFTNRANDKCKMPPPPNYDVNQMKRFISVFNEITYNHNPFHQKFSAN